MIVIIQMKISIMKFKSRSFPQKLLNTLKLGGFQYMALNIWRTLY